MADKKYLDDLKAKSKPQGQYALVLDNNGVFKAYDYNDKDVTLSYFKKPEKVIPNEGKRQLYENLSYDPKTEKKYIFSTGLPKIKN